MSATIALEATKSVVASQEVATLATGSRGERIPGISQLHTYSMFTCLSIESAIYLDVLV